LINYSVVLLGLKSQPNFFLPLVYILSILSPMSEVQHSIKFAAKKTGLSTHVIRMWEKRYDAVSPNRSDTNRRCFTDEEIERLTLLRSATLAGHSIGNVARLPLEKLRALTQDAPSSSPATASNDTSVAPAIAEAVQAILDHNSVRLEQILSRAAVQLGFHGLLEKVIAPLAYRVGDLWADGSITAAHEHFASAIIRNFLVKNARPYASSGSVPSLIVATPAGQLHELGAVMVAAAANDMGWRVVYLGTSLPSLEIAGAAIRNQARAVALSIVFPGDDPNLPGELENLRTNLPAEIKLIVGGRAAESYTNALEKVGATRTKSLGELYSLLEQLRQRTG
jgi:methylmalonyl-CoA mutase cobalamin-binding domain/chain